MEIKQKTPLVSIIIPLYNAQEYILQTLKSIEAQTYKNYEVIVVDNVSTDGSYELVKGFIRNIDDYYLLQTDENSGGPAHPRNLGIEQARGAYIAFLDSDDVWHSRKLDVQMSLMLNYGLNFTSTNSFLIDDHSKPIKNKAKNISDKMKKYGIKSMLFKNTVVTSSVVLNRSFLGNLRFNEANNFVTVEDYFLWLNLLAKKECNFSHLTGQFVDYRVLSKSLGNKGGKLRFALKGLLAATQFLIETKQANLIYIILLSNILRVFKLSLTRSL